MRMRSFSSNRSAEIGVLMAVMILIMMFGAMEYFMTDNNYITEFADSKPSIEIDQYVENDTNKEAEPDFWEDPLGWIGHAVSSFGETVIETATAAVNMLGMVFDFLVMIFRALVLDFATLSHVGVFQWVIKVPIWTGLGYGIVKALPTT